MFWRLIVFDPNFELFPAPKPNYQLAMLTILRVKRDVSRMPRPPLNEVVRDEILNCTLGAVTVQAHIQCQRDLRCDVSFSLLQRCYNFQITEFGAAGLPPLFQAFHEYYFPVALDKLGLDPTKFCEQYGFLGDGTLEHPSQSSPEINRNIVLKAVCDVLTFIDKVLTTYQAESLLYASWYCQVAQVHVSPYQDLIAAVACGLIVSETIMHPRASDFELLVFE